MEEIDHQKGVKADLLKKTYSKTLQVGKELRAKGESIRPNSSNKLQGLTPPICGWSFKQLLGPGHHSVTRSGDQNLKDFHVMTRKITDKKTII